MVKELKLYLVNSTYLKFLKLQYKIINTLKKAIPKLKGFAFSLLLC